MIVDRISRGDFLQVLESVTPGLSPKGIVEQSGSFVFQNGRVVTYNEDIACRAKSGLPKDFTGAVKSKAMIDLLRALKDDVIGIDADDSHMVISGKGRRAKLRMDSQITIPMQNLEKPEVWTPVNEEFNDAINVVQGCAGKDVSKFATTCIHIHPKWMEACDNYHLARYKIETGVKEPIMVLRDALKHVAGLDMTHFSETPKWIHFRNPAGVILSTQRHVEQYPNLKSYLDVDGTPATLPKGLSSAVSLAKIFSQENADANLVVIQLTANKLVVTGIGSSGEYSEVKKLVYSGPDLEFTVPPEIISEISSKYSECIINPKRLMVKGGKWTYVTTLGDSAAVKAAREGSVGKTKKEKEETDDVADAGYGEEG